jgi:hypothetical protein
VKKILLLTLLSLQFAMSGSAQVQSPVLRHVVLFKFKETATADQVKAIEEAFKALPAKIKLIKNFEWGTNNSPEKLNQGLTHCFFLGFQSEKDRDAYLVHPVHKAFTELAGSQIDKVTVVDYWVK